MFAESDRRLDAVVPKRLPATDIQQPQQQVNDHTRSSKIYSLFLGEQKSLSGCISLRIYLSMFLKQVVFEVCAALPVNPIYTRSHTTANDYPCAHSFNSQHTRLCWGLGFGVWGLGFGVW